MTLTYLNVFIANHLQDPDADVLLTYRCENGFNELSFKQTHTHILGKFLLLILVSMNV